jgi:hypothetical protein
MKMARPPHPNSNLTEAARIMAHAAAAHRLRPFIGTSQFFFSFINDFLRKAELLW